MKEFLYVILLNTAVFMIAFFSLKLYDKKTGKDTVNGLKVTYIISAVAAAYIAYTGLGEARDYKTVLFTVLVCMFPVSAMVNCGYAIAVFFKAIVEKVRGAGKKAEEEKKTVTVTKSKKSRKKK